MVPLASLWLPILLAAVAVFVASSLIHMVLKYHNSDYRGLPNEDQVRAAIRSSNPAPGQYFMPHCPDHKELKKPEVQQKFIDGPVGIITLMRPGPPTMGKPLVLWFILNLLIAIAAGYLASRTVPHGASFLAVCRVVGLVTFLAYAGGAVSNAIWYGRTQSAAIKDVIDAFIFGLVSAAVFGWLWPR